MTRYGNYPGRQIFANPDDEVIRHEDLVIDAEAKAAGEAATDADTNPYKPRTAKWFSWNRGRNKEILGKTLSGQMDK